MHTTVLLEEAIDALQIDNSKKQIFIDGTFGRGGHTKLLLSKINASSQVFAFDKDITAINVAKEISKNDARLSIFHTSFANLDEVVEPNSIAGILLDLGISSPQIDNKERGFSFMQDGDLDMRMNQQQALSAKTFINSVAEEDLADILFNFGEERYSRRIAKSIVQRREKQAFERTLDLANVIKEAHPKWQKGKHPATQSFQAIRIYINNELDDLKIALEKTYNALQIGGMLVIISFHSLEDRMVKQFLKDKAKPKQIYPKDLPIFDDNNDIKMKLISKIKPNKVEIDANVRSRSAVMRVAQKIK